MASSAARAAAAATVRGERRLSFRKLWSVGFGYPGYLGCLGHHIGVARRNAGLSGTLETAGARVESLPTSG